jgi:hypothetical protein
MRRKGIDTEFSWGNLLGRTAIWKTHKKSRDNIKLDLRESGCDETS